MNARALDILTTAVRVVIRIDAVSLVALGALVLAGGPARFPGPTYRAQSELAPGWVWGASAIVGGVLVLAGSLADVHPRGRRLAMVGLFVGAGWTGFFAAAFVVGAVLEVLRPGPNMAPLLGIAIYGGAATRLAFLAGIARHLPGGR